MEDNKYYILKHKGSKFGENSLVGVVKLKEKCAGGHAKLKVSTYHVPHIIDSKSYCECTYRYFCSLKGTWWKRISDKSHIKVIDDVPHISGICYYRDLKYDIQIKFWALFDYYELEIT